MEKKQIEADVLCVGGGIVGLMAAIRAAELGAKVIVIEKANTLRSGGGGTGNDHFLCYIPEVHGPDMSVVVESVRLGQEAGAISDPRRIKPWFEKSFDIVKMWDSWGIPMRHDGKWEFSGHALPGKCKAWLRYDGMHQKPVLTEQALKRGVKIINRVMVFNLLGGANGVTGALGAGTREDSLVEFQAKSVILGTGRMQNRLYRGPNLPLPGNWGRVSLSGDGRAMASRLGAELVNMEGGVRGHLALKYFTISGQATWIGVYRDAEGRPIGKFITKPNRLMSDMVAEVGQEAFVQVMETGRGPTYMDLRGASVEDIEYMKHWLHNEGNTITLEHLEQEGVDLRKNQIEFSPGRGSFAGGRIKVNEKTETSIKGLYAAGDETHVTISNAAVFGWYAGDNAASFAKKAASPNIDKEKDKIKQWENLIAELQNRRHGPDWEDANAALNNVMADYLGIIRSETMLEAGLSHLRRLRDKARTTIMAKDRWELTRCLEVLNLYDLAELAFVAALERKESRGTFRRVDYPYTDPLLNGKTLVGKMIDGNPVVEWKESTEQGPAISSNTGALL